MTAEPSSTPPPQSPKHPSSDTLTDDAVLSYLRQRGFGHAASHLAKLIASETTAPPSSSDNNKLFQPTNFQRDLEPHEESIRSNEQVLGLSMGTSGGMGYDLDSGVGLVSWGLGGAVAVEDAVPNGEARQLLAAFAALQTYVNALPDEKGGNGNLESDDSVRDDMGLFDGDARVSVKKELMSVCFPLLVHAYCDLLEMGFDNESKALLLCWRGFHEEDHGEAILDLVKCSTKAKILDLNALFLKYNELHAKIRTQQEKQKAMLAHRANRARYVGSMHSDNLDNNNHPAAATALADLAKIDEQIAILRNKENEAADRCKSVSERLENYPFLKRARSSRWKLTLSTESYSILSSFLSNQSMIPLTTLLQSKCNIDVEERDPLPYVPALVFEDDDVQKPIRTISRPKIGKDESDDKVNWAVPSLSDNAIFTAPEKDLPFPDYDDPDSFNNALLLHGFRRLAALETKMHLDDLERSRSTNQNNKSVIDTTERSQVADPLAPSTLLSTCCTIATSLSNIDIEGSDIGIICGTSSPVDGRRIAVGCEDASVRVWALDGSHRRRKVRDRNTVECARGSTEDAGDAMVLIGHKGGWPVYGVDFCRDGRHLISCGGDGTIRLWDTYATGSIGAPEPKYPKTNSSASPTPNSSKSNAEIKGAALCVYRGHAVGTPVWDCKFSPSGYYFASGGMDNTVRLWTTDRIAPIRAFTGHLSSVGCVAWHPNCNYVFSGSDDRTVRMWDIQSGRCVRLFTGSTRFVTSLAVSPNGRNVVAGDGKGNIHVWDIATGRLVTDLRPKCPEGSPVYSLAYSSCGSALASGGADGCVRIWNVSNTLENRTVPSFVKEDVCKVGSHGLLTDPKTEFRTKKTEILSLFYTKRNLLMGVGKYSSSGTNGIII